MHCPKIKKLFSLTLLLLFLAVPANSLAETQDLWTVKKNEHSLQGLYLGFTPNRIQIKIHDQLSEYPFSSEALFALRGLYSGKLISLPQFPRGIPVQIILDHTGTIRAMSNEQEPCKFISGTALKSWGHLATLSPTEKYYTLFNLWEGLFLHNLEEKMAPVFLTTHPLCSWNNAGTKLAYADQHYLGVLDLPQNIKKIYPFPSNDLGTVRVVTAIAWSPQDEQLCYAFLEDYPQQGSDIFQITILNKNGKELATKTIENLGPICWLTEELILIVVNPSEQETGKFMIWNYKTNKSTTIFNQLEGFCNNLSFNHKSQSLAYTTAGDGDWQESLYLFTLKEKKVRQIKSFISPLYHLQWTQDNTLIFWEEINNSINIIKETGEILKKFTGFLPEKGAANRFLYFPEEPREEALPLYLSP